MTHESPDKAFEALLAEFIRRNPDASTGVLTKAYNFAHSAHSKQFRKSGEPYILHPIAVAMLCVELNLDQATVCAALLHDTVEDNKEVLLEDVAAEFGKEVAALVDGLTKADRFNYSSRVNAQAETYRKLIIATSKDIRVVILKLCDRLHNIRTISAMTPSSQRRIAIETRDLYAPIASRLGMDGIKTELEDICFRVLEPDDYYALAEQIASKKAERDAYVRDAVQILREFFEEEGIDVEVQGRSKHLYSVWKKMNESGRSVDQIHDLIALRIILNNAEPAECYTVLGLLHTKWKSIPAGVKDYISVPKGNGYSSIHTRVIGPAGHMLEVQIRTREMHKQAEYGVAAHWAYKEGKTNVKSEDSHYVWLRRLIESNQSIKDGSDYIDALKWELHEEDVFVFTPDGDVLHLPKGSTPIDFAYYVHSEVGNHAQHVKVNGHIVDLRTTLKMGDRVEVMTNKDQHPKPEWLEFVVSRKAKDRIRQYLNSQGRAQSIERGQSMLSAELRKHGLKLDALVRKGRLAEVADKLKHQSVDMLLASLGKGVLTLDPVIRSILDPSGGTPARQVSTERMQQINNRLRRTLDLEQDAVPVVAGVEGDVVTVFARCCSPVLGDEIVGYVTTGRGITIHTKECERLHNLDSARLLPLTWQSRKGKGGGSKRSVTIYFTGKDRDGLLQDVTAAVGAADLKMNNVHASADGIGEVIGHLELMIEDRSQLNDIMATIKKIRNIYTVRSQGSSERA